MNITCSSYDIVINDWSELRDFTKKNNFSKLLVIVDENTKQNCLPILEKELGRHFCVIETLAGEEHKTINTCIDIWKSMVDHSADRHSLCINLGGGVIGDMGGFAAATFMRGMSFIQMPTSLLSQVDASVGGKLGVDFKNYKNLIGLILPPSAVFIFTEFLDTLPQRQMLSGYAELLKHGLIAKENVFHKLSETENIHNLNWEETITESVIIKKDITEEDPKEKGIRKILNFGHTIGHAVESLNLKTDNPLLHGECVAIGMICESHLSMQLSFISSEDCDIIKTAILKHYDHHPEKISSIAELMPIMAKDKKNKGGTIRFSLLESIGTGNFDNVVTEDMIERSLAYYIKA